MTLAEAVAAFLATVSLYTLTGLLIGQYPREDSAWEHSTASLTEAVWWGVFWPVALLGDPGIGRDE